MANEDKDPNTGKPLLAGLLDVKTGILAVVAILTAWNTYTSNVTKNELAITTAKLDTARTRIQIQSAILSNQTQELENDLRKREFGNNLKFKLYEEVRSAITKHEPGAQDAVVLIINEMLADDSAFRAKLSNILYNSKNTDPTVKSTIAETRKVEAVFAREQNEIPTLTKAVGKELYTIDVFYLDDIVKESLPRAKKIETLLKEKYPDFQIRRRALPKTINAKAGYSIGANQIRFEGTERAMASEIMEYIEKSRVFEREQLQEYLIKNKTPNYISIFVRNM